MATTKTTRAASKPPSRKMEDKEQYERFRKFAREVGADDDTDAFDDRVRRIVRPKHPRSS